jgi:drug/metabolite transporter (DMT)-like permease
MRAMRYLPASIVTTISCVYALVPLFYRTIFMHVGLSIYQWLGVLAALSGAALISLDLREVSGKPKGILIHGIGKALYFPVLYGIGVIFMDQVTMRVDWFTTYWYQTLFGLGVVPALLIMTRKMKQTHLPKRIGPVLLNVIGSIAAFFILYWGYDYGETAIVSVISTLTPVVVVVLSYFLLRERLLSNQYVGIGVAMLGLILLSIQP